MFTATRQFVISVMDRAFTFLEEQGRWVFKEGKTQLGSSQVAADLGFWKSGWLERKQEEKEEKHTGWYL